MEIYPAVSRKRFGECQGGELIRLGWHSGTAFALAVERGGEARRVDSLALLAGFNGKTPPVIGHFNEPDEEVVSYGMSYRVEVDQSDEQFDPDARKFWNKNGALHVSGGHYLMRTHPMDPRNGTFFIEMDTGRAVNKPPGNAMIYAKWSLMLPKGHGRFETIFELK